MQTEIINKIVSDITGKIDVDKIFFYPEQHLAGKTHKMLILVANHFQHSLNGLVDQVQQLVGEQMPFGELEVVFSHLIRETMRIGNLYFYSRCVDANLIYSRPCAVYNMFEGLLPYYEVLDRAKERFEIAMEKVGPFADAAELYYSKQQYPSAAFVLHQIVELTFRAIELFFLGKETRNHETTIHLRYLERHLPFPKINFPVKPTTDDELLRLLDDAYLGVRYGELFKISKEQVEQLREWASDFSVFAHEVQAAFLTEYAVVADEAENTEVGIDNDSDDLRRMISLINKHMATEMVICLGKRSLISSRMVLSDMDATPRSSTHYDLLVLSEEQYPEVMMLQGKVNDLQGPNCRINLLFHTISELRREIENGNSFFGLAMLKGIVLQGEEQVQRFRPLITHTSPQRLDKTTPRTWHCRRERAEAFLLGAESVRYEDGNMIAISLLSQCLEQVCLGVIFTCLDYRPKIHNLNHLLSLCVMACAEFEDIIPRYTAEDKRFYKVLLDGISDIRYREEVYLDMDILQLLFDRCENFMAKAMELCDAMLKK